MLFAMAFGRPYLAPVTHTYLTVGSHSEVIPTGASHVKITIKGGGAGGNYTHAGGAGGLSVKDVDLLPSDWGATIAMFVGDAGSGGTTGGTNTNGGASTSSATLALATVSMTANGGGAAGGGGTASGGDTNTTGGGAAGGAQGFQTDSIPGSNGSVGSAQFAYT